MPLNFLTSFTMYNSMKPIATSGTNIGQKIAQVIVISDHSLPVRYQCVNFMCVFSLLYALQAMAKPIM